MVKNNSHFNGNRYHTLSMSLHWLTLLLVIAVYACIELREIYPKGSEPREALKMWHFMLGLTVLGVTAVRLISRLLLTAPPITPAPPVWQLKLAKLVHLALYAFLLVMPLLGWLVLSAAEKPIPFFGFHLPALLAPNKDLAHTLKEIHETIGVLGYYLIGLHAAAAIFHHLFMRDDTLLRMLPERCRNRLQ